jgi:hypothetical protein
VIPTLESTYNLVAASVFTVGVAKLVILYKFIERSLLGVVILFNVTEL